jgi:hypothetical protein
VQSVEELMVNIVTFEYIAALIQFLDSDPSEELPLAARSSANKAAEATAQPLDPPTSSQVTTPDTPPGNQNQPSTSHRKGGRPPNARKGKLGKNHYTKDKDLQDGDDPSPNRSQSRDVARGDDNGHTSGNKVTNNEGKPGRSRGNGGSKITMGDMKKRVAAILDFISRTQLEMAGDPSNNETAEKTICDLAEGLPMMRVNGEKMGGANEGDDKQSIPAKNFKDLSCMQMMDALTAELVKWQREFT